MRRATLDGMGGREEGELGDCLDRYTTLGSPFVFVAIEIDPLSHKNRFSRPIFTVDRGHIRLVLGWRGRE